ncbi:MFS transporter [Steroidobacter sp.]|uniref:MFS transporter n=1 Tax=Steroidobacter sp. TaxID=1978227 RepID=UPI001A58D185|nr:MFS transporter [Steroidobacter sp.]MBL8264745.1 MFS transporter [Steroidobacter sp.]
MVGNALNPGTLAFYSLGVLSPALQREYGWSAGAAAGGLFAVSVTTLLVSPLAGALTDRLGARKVASWSVVLLSLTLCLLATVPLSLPMYYGLWMLAAAGGAGSFPFTWSRLITQHFRRKCGLALGLSFVGTGLAGALLKPPLFQVVEQHGVQGGFWFLAVLPLLSLITTLLLVRPMSAVPRTDAAAKPVAAEGVTLAEATRDWRFWLLALVVASAAIGVGGPLPNMESVLRATGYSGAEAVALAQLIGLAIIFGRIGCGALLDRIWAPAVGAVVLAAGGLGCLAAWSTTEPSWTAGVTVFLIATASGLEVELVAFLALRYFGLKNYSSIYGVLYGIFALGTGVGAISFGVIFDATGSYGPALMSFGLLLIGAAAAILWLGAYRYETRSQ